MRFEEWLSPSVHEELINGYGSPIDKVELGRQIWEAAKSDVLDEIKKYIEVYNKPNMVAFAAEMVWKYANPESEMECPNAVYIKIEKELKEWTRK